MSEEPDPDLQPEGCLGICTALDFFSQLCLKISGFRKFGERVTYNKTKIIFP